MPITIDEFESRDSERGETNAERVVRFLGRNRDKAYKATEIAEAVRINENSIHPVLKRLEERKLVRHREPYWAITDDDERLQTSYRLHRHHETANEQYGEEHLGDLQTDEMERVQ